MHHATQTPQEFETKRFALEQRILELEAGRMERFVRAEDHASLAGGRGGAGAFPIFGVLPFLPAWPVGPAAPSPARGGGGGASPSLPRLQACLVGGWTYTPNRRPYS